jgi:hypothetical protein
MNGFRPSPAPATRLVFLIAAGFSLALSFVSGPASACDCAGTKPEDIFAKASLLFIGRAGAMDFQTRAQPYEVLAVLKGKPDSAQKHVIRFGPDLHDCLAIEQQGSVALIALVNKEPSICEGSGSLHGYHQQVGKYLKLAGAKPGVLTEAILTASLEPFLKSGSRPVFLVTPGLAGRTLTIAGRSVKVIDAVDGTPANADVFEIGAVLSWSGLLYVELAGKPLAELEALVQVPAKGPPTLLWAFSKGGRLRVPEPK